MRLHRIGGNASAESSTDLPGEGQEPVWDQPHWRLHRMEGNASDEDPVPHLRLQRIGSSASAESSTEPAWDQHFMQTSPLNARINSQSIRSSVSSEPSAEPSSDRHFTPVRAHVHLPGTGSIASSEPLMEPVSRDQQHHCTQSSSLKAESLTEPVAYLRTAPVVSNEMLTESVVSLSKSFS